MQRLLAITWLTLKAALRFRLVLVLSVVLLGGVVVLPLIIKDDGSARGFTQILLTYTLSMITALLGLATLWLACGTMARDMEESQIQMVAVKPIARWQIWLGKWLGILCLNAALLTVAGGAVFALMQWRAQKLPEKEQTILRNEVMVARASAREPMPDYSQDVAHLVEARIKANPQIAADQKELRKISLEQLKARDQVVPPNAVRQWDVPMGLAAPFLRDQPLFLRVKFNAAQTNLSGNYAGLWEVGPAAEPARTQRKQMNMAADTFTEFQIPPNLFDKDGVLSVRFYNGNETALLFSLEEGLEVLYREGSFGLNFARGVGIIFCWLAFLAALGLAAASFLSFPVAAFVSLGVLMVGLSSGTLSQVVEEGGIMGVNHETGLTDAPTLIDRMAVPTAKGLLQIINLIRGFSPIDSLSSGRSITWIDFARAFGKICDLLSGIVAVIGISIFTRRELATAQTHQ